LVSSSILNMFLSIRFVLSLLLTMDCLFHINSTKPRGKIFKLKFVKLFIFVSHFLVKNFRFIIPQISSLFPTGQFSPMEIFPFKAQ
jgi:hypothetical protein